MFFLMRDWSKRITKGDIRGYHPNDFPDVRTLRPLRVRLIQQEREFYGCYRRREYLLVYKVVPENTQRKHPTQKTGSYS